MSISLFLFKFCEDSGPSSIIFREELAKNSVTIERAPSNKYERYQATSWLARFRAHMQV